MDLSRIKMFLKMKYIIWIMIEMIFKWKRQNGTLFDFLCGMHSILRKIDVAVPCDSKFLDALRVF